jgi:hypothetical protein
MVAKTQKPCPEPPDWWHVSLYKFLKDMPLRGWVWEFMRRDRLKKVFKIKPIGAMKPNVQRGEVPEASYLYYWPWPVIISNFKEPFYRPPAVTLKDDKKWYWEEPVRLGLYEKVDWSVETDTLPETMFKEVLVDLNRRDAVILDDFTKLLKQLRQQHGKLKRMNPRVADWKGSHILQVWDLRDFNIPWPRIAELYNWDSLDGPRDAYRTAREYVDREKWKRLALYCEALERKPRSRY